MALLLRAFIIVLVIYLFYKIIRYVFDPKRKFDEAVEQHAYYFYDDPKDVRKNFLLTYKGAVFIGEKYLGTTHNSIDVISITISVKDLASLNGFNTEDFSYLQQEIADNYPHAKLSWIDPIEHLLKKQKNESI